MGLLWPALGAVLLSEWGWVGSRSTGKPEGQVESKSKLPRFRFPAGSPLHTALLYYEALERATRTQARMALRYMAGCEIDPNKQRKWRMLSTNPPRSGGSAWAGEGGKKAAVLPTLDIAPWGVAEKNGGSGF